MYNMLSDLKCIHITINMAIHTYIYSVAKVDYRGAAAPKKAGFPV